MWPVNVREAPRKEEGLNGASAERSEDWPRHQGASVLRATCCPIHKGIQASVVGLHTILVCQRQSQFMVNAIVQKTKLSNLNVNEFLYYVTIVI